ncbi:protein of unknown function [Magnetospirillum sp. XM-1]|nr:protein of unknown function [Magnetospirillum sp. XM-1]
MVTLAPLEPTIRGQTPIVSGHIKIFVAKKLVDRTVILKVSLLPSHRINRAIRPQANVSRARLLEGVANNESSGRD